MTGGVAQDGPPIITATSQLLVRAERAPAFAQDRNSAKEQRGKALPAWLEVPPGAGA